MVQRQVVLLVALALLGGGRAWASVTLVERGQARAVIVIPATANETEARAASELQDYLKQMSGAALAVSRTDEAPAGPAVLIGRAALVNVAIRGLMNERRLGYDGFVLRTAGNHVLVVGHRGEGTRFAVFALLEKLGCRFFTPNPDGEHVPTLATIRVPDLDVVSKPDFAHRAPWNNGNVLPTLTPETRRRWDLWYVKNRLGGVDFHHSHNYEGFCPPKEYFAQHPEYFPLQRGDGGADRRIPGGQLCLSNPGVVGLAVQAARLAFDRNPQLRSYSLSPNDTGGWCECDECRAMDDPDPAVGLATRVLAFNNRVAAQLEKTHPDRLLAYYAEYVNIPGPPVRRDGTVVLKAHPAVMPVLNNIYCLLHDVGDPRCKPNLEYRWRLDAWSKVANHLFIYEWFMYSDLPTPVTWNVGPRIRNYRDKGFLGYSGEVLGRSPDNDLALYIAARMLWNASQDDRALIDEFMRLQYGEAAGAMRRYYRRLNQVGRDGKTHGFRLPTDAWTPRVFRELKGPLEDARRAARKPAVRRRVEREWKAFEAHRRYALAQARYQLWTARPDTATLATARRAVADAVTFLTRIADEDIVAEGILLGNLRVLSRRLEGGQAVPPNSAQNQPGWSDEETFGDLWATHRELAPLPTAWRFRLDPRRRGEREKWFAPDLDEKGWNEIRVGEFWEAQGYRYDGVAWYRTRVRIPEVPPGSPVLLYFGAADESAWVWVNGEKAGEHDIGEAGWDRRFALDITRLVKPGEEAVIVVKVLDRGLMGGLWKSVKLVTRS